MTGADLSVPMTDYARSRLGPAGISNADFMTCDLQIDKLEADKFDAAFSRFGVMFFDQPVVGFSNIRTAMKSAHRWPLCVGRHRAKTSGIVWLWRQQRSL